MDHKEKTRALRACEEIHYNCCQSVLLTFTEELGLTEQQLYALGTNFSGGMRHGSACGALAGAMMVLGLMGYGDEAAQPLLRQFKQAHEVTDCASLLRAAHHRGESRKSHCDNLVYEMVEAVEQVLQQSKEE